MPILTEQELQDIVNKETEANAKLEEKDEQLRESYREKERIRTQKRGFLTSTVILGILFLALLFTVLFQPYLLQLDNGIQLADDEEVVKKTTLKNYQDRVVELESQLESNSPLDLNEFYAVQLGAFKKFNTQLSSDDFSVVHNANFKDFNVYTLGVFKTEEEAEKLRKVVSQLSFKDAFIGLYKNGERVKSNY